jgi:DNA-binding NarL/FixJ family response regulator
MSAKPIRIVIADDHAIVRAGLRELLHQEADLSVVGEAASGEEALDLAATLKPDVILLDQSMPGLTGLEVLAQLTERQPAVQCIILTGFADHQTFFQALELGAAGYLLKTASHTELAEAVRAAHTNGLPIDPRLATALIHHIHQPEPQPSPMPSPLGDLTLREIEILDLVAQGLTNVEIAQNLAISHYTVRSHIYRILQKLNLASRTQAALFYLSQRTGFPTGHARDKRVPHR